MGRQLERDPCFEEQGPRFRNETKDLGETSPRTNSELEATDAAYEDLQNKSIYAKIEDSEGTSLAIWILPV